MQRDRVMIPGRRHSQRHQRLVLVCVIGVSVDVEDGPLCIVVGRRCSYVHARWMVVSI